MLGAYPDFRTPFKLILTAESYFFTHDLKIKLRKKKERGGRTWQLRSEKHMAFHGLLSYLEAACELLGLNQMKFVKLAQHTDFGREKNPRLKEQLQNIVVIGCHHHKAYLENPGKTAECAQGCSLS